MRRMFLVLATGCWLAGCGLVPGGGASRPRPEPAVCSAGTSCVEGEYCRLPAGSCQTPGATGHCVRRPQRCTDEKDPVCGCDDRTYANRCEAARAGVNIAHDGPCAGQPCGGPDRIPCPAGQYCRVRGMACKDPDAEGVCHERPERCRKGYFPVCGCDGRTYGNACWAAMAGVGIYHEGECRLGVCGGPDGIACPAGEFCDLGTGNCGLADALGTCRPRPPACGRQYDPVCGCDGRTYENPCEAARAGVTVDHAGACR